MVGSLLIDLLQTKSFTIYNTRVVPKQVHSTDIAAFMRFATDLP